MAIETIIESQPDGVAAWLLRLPPNAALVPPGDAKGADRFYLVGAGVMNARGAQLPRFATAFVSADERVFELVAGEEGLEALVLQFPAGTQVTG